MSQIYAIKSRFNFESKDQLTKKKDRILIKDLISYNLIPLQLTGSNRDSVRKACEALLIDKTMTLEPHGINRRDELN